MTSLKELDAVKRNITILFSDLQNSTSLGVDYSLEQSATFINAYHELMETAVHAAGGEVAQIGGDDFVAYFGYPAKSDGSGLAAINAGLAAIRGAQILNMQGKLPLAIRIGIHEGPAVLFESSNQDVQFGGNTPVVAARLQAHARPNSVLISQDVATRVEQAVELKEIGPLTLKGLPQAVTAFEVQRLLPRRSHEQGADARSQSVFVGRRAQLNWLAERIETKTPLSIVIGEPGIGKTRLVDYFVSSRGEKWLQVRGELEAQRRPLHFFLQLIDALAPDKSRPYLERLQELSPQHADHPDLETLFGEDGRPTEMDPSIILPDLLREMLVRADQNLWIDDLQWLDTLSSRALLSYATSNDNPISIIATARPELDLDTPSTTELTPLSLTETQGLAANLNAASDTETVARHLHKMTNGNPLYVEQLTIALSDEGLLVPGNSEDLTLAVLPPTLTELLVSRIDSLGESRSLLQTCSLLGDKFELSLLAETHSQDAQLLENQLNILEQRFLLQRVDTDIWEFRHGLIRDAAAATLLADDRQLIHQRIAGALETRTPTVFPAIIADHWEQGGQSQLAIAGYTQAAEELLGRSLHRDALAQCERALEILATHPNSKWRNETEYALLVLLGNTLSVLENYGSERRLQVSEETLALSDKIGRYGSELIPILYGRWTVHLARSDLQTRDWAERLALIASQNPADALPQIDTTTNFVLGVTRFMEGEITTAIEHLEQAIAHYDQSQHVRLMQMYGEDHGLYASVWLQWAYVHAGRINDARQQCNVSDRIAAKFNDPMSSMLAMTYKMHVHIELQELDDVLSITEDIIEAVKQNGMTYYKLIAEGSKARALMLSGRLEEADANYIRGNRYAPEYFLLLVTVNRDFVNHNIQIGDLSAASGEIEAARKMLKDSFEGNYVPEFLFLEGKILEKEGKTGEACEAYQKCYDLAHARGANYFSVKAGMAMAQLDPAQNTRERETNWVGYLAQGECELYRQAREVAEQAF